MIRSERTILRNLMKSAKSYWRLLRDSEIDGPAFSDALGSLLTQGLVEERGEILYITDQGQLTIHDLMAQQDLTCPTCTGHTVSAQGPFQGLLEEFITIGKERPSSISEFDQGAILPENTISRALYMYQRGDLDRQKLFFLGDDDLTSVACALTRLPAEITVLEIDRRLNDFLRQTAVKHGFTNFTVLDYDARDPIPKELQGQFDVFFTDPVETLQGITLFLSRCTSALRGEGSAGYFGFTRIECPLKKWQAVESRLLEMNFAITDIIRNYHEYYLEPLGIAERGYRITTNAPIDVGTPDVNFFRSNLVRIELVGPAKPTIREPVTWGRDLYYDEEMWVTLPDELL